MAILDADKEGFLRSDRSLIQTIGRAARNLRSKAILYADQITGSMRRALDETERRRTKQQTYNQTHGITRAASRRRWPTSWKARISIPAHRCRRRNTPRLPRGRRPTPETPALLMKKIKQLERRCTATPAIWSSKALETYLQPQPPAGQRYSFIGIGLAVKRHPQS